MCCFRCQQNHVFLYTSGMPRRLREPLKEHSHMSWQSKIELNGGHADRSISSLRPPGSETVLDSCPKENRNPKSLENGRGISCPLQKVGEVLSGSRQWNLWGNRMAAWATVLVATASQNARQGLSGPPFAAGVPSSWGLFASCIVRPGTGRRYQAGPDG